MLKWGLGIYFKHKLKISTRIYAAEDNEDYMVEIKLPFEY